MEVQASGGSTRQSSVRELSALLLVCCPSLGSWCVTGSPCTTTHICFRQCALPPVGSIRPYLVAARKWYSEADAGPGAETEAEAGAGFGGRC